MQNAIIDINQIMKMIPHRYPFLLVDRVIENNDDGIVAIKNVTINEQFFMGHFPQKPIMPGVLLIEAMAQAAAIFVAHQLSTPSGQLVYLAAIEKARFRKPVTPGDVLYLHIKKISHRMNLWKMEGEVRVEGEKVAEATFSAVLADNKDIY